MKRRDLIAGMALAGMSSAEPQTQESLYIPKAHLVEDRKFLHDFMDEYSFVELVTGAPEIRITHIPVWMDGNRGEYGTIYGHISRQNPQTAAFDGKQPAVIVFRGPHSYISPTWYTKTDVVPTWNFAVVHASGKLRAITEKKEFHELLAKLIRKYEGVESPAYDFGKLPESYTSGLMQGIVGFEMQIERLEGKFKLGQERSEADKQSIVKHLASAKSARPIGELTAAFYERTRR